MTATERALSPVGVALILQACALICSSLYLTSLISTGDFFLIVLAIIIDVGTVTLAVLTAISIIHGP